MLDAQAVVDASVGDVGLDAGRPCQAGGLNVVGVDAGDLGGVGEVPLLQVLAPDIPDRAGGVNGTILQGNLELAIDRGVNQRVEVGKIGDPTCDRVVAGVGGILHAPLRLGVQASPSQ